MVDDLIAICIIAIFYTNNFHGEYLLFALIPLALFAFIAYRGETMLHLKPLAGLVAASAPGYYHLGALPRVRYSRDHFWCGSGLPGAREDIRSL